MTNLEEEPMSGEAGAGAGEGRRRAGVAIAGVLALLVFGGVSWAATNAAKGPGETVQPAAATALPSNGPFPATSDPPSMATPSETAATATVPPADPGPGAAEVPPGAEAPPPADPATVDRKGQSEKQLAEIPQPVAPPVELNAKKTVKTGISAAISGLTAVQGEAQGVGEVAGPALRFKLTVTNDTDKELSLASALVNVTFGADEAPAGELSGPDTVAFPASVAPGGTAEAVYVFSVPADSRDDVRIYFNLEAETPISAFAGKAPA